MTVSLNLQDILRSSPEYNELSEEERKRLFLDAHLCLQAVGPQTDDALDLVWLLRSLDADDPAQWKIAPYHQEPLPYEDNCILETSKTRPFPTSSSHVWSRLPFSAPRRLECCVQPEADPSSKTPRCFDPRFQRLAQNVHTPKRLREGYGPYQTEGVA